MSKSSSQLDSISSELVWVLSDLGELGADSPCGVIFINVWASSGAGHTHICTWWGYILGNRTPDHTWFYWALMPCPVALICVHCQNSLLWHSHHYGPWGILLLVPLLLLPLHLSGGIQGLQTAWVHTQSPLPLGPRSQSQMMLLTVCLLFSLLWSSVGVPSSSCLFWLSVGSVFPTAYTSLFFAPGPQSACASQRRILVDRPSFLKIKF